MEINGRFWGSLQLAVDAGVDFPNMLVDAATGVTRRRRRRRTASACGTAGCWGDLDSLLLRLHGGRSRPRRGAAARAPARVLSFLKLWGRDLHYENPRADDLGPWLARERGRLVPEVRVSPRPGNPGPHPCRAGDRHDAHRRRRERGRRTSRSGLDRSRFDVTLCCTRERGVLAERLAASGVDVPPRRAADAPAALPHAVLPRSGSCSRLRRRRRAHARHAEPAPRRSAGDDPAWCRRGSTPSISATIRCRSRRMMAGERFFSRFATELVAVVRRRSVQSIDHAITARRGAPHDRQRRRGQPVPRQPVGREARRASSASRPTRSWSAASPCSPRQKGITYLLQAAPRSCERTRGCGSSSPAAGRC